jgi:hypothetical protein
MQVLAWRKKYVVVEYKFGHDLTKVRAIRPVCEKVGCNNSSRIHRHHKGHDYIFACLFPDIFAPRYIEFNPEDIVYLCNTHHEKIHRYYKPVVDEFYYMFNGTDSKLAQLKLCDEYKARLTEMCDKFLRTKPRRTNAQRYR